MPSNWNFLRLLLKEPLFKMFNLLMSQGLTELIMVIQDFWNKLYILYDVQ